MCAFIMLCNLGVTYIQISTTGDSVFCFVLLFIFTFFMISVKNEQKNPNPTLRFKHPGIMGSRAPFPESIDRNIFHTFFHFHVFTAHLMNFLCLKNAFCFSWVEKKAALQTLQPDNNRFQSQRARVGSTNSSCDPPIIRL